SSARFLLTARHGLNEIAARVWHSSRQGQATAPGTARGFELRRTSERVGLSGAEPRQYCRAVSAILHWSAEDSPTPSKRTDTGPLRPEGPLCPEERLRYRRARRRSAWRSRRRSIAEAGTYSRKSWPGRRRSPRCRRCRDSSACTRGRALARFAGSG